ncbi:MAG: hypothetical protein JOZ87_39745 [Chloroflexi bacterium]|nr:hypothetical protein [Chloroflexota bacterium]
MIRQLGSAALAVFIAGGLLSGTLGLNSLAGVVATRERAKPTPSAPAQSAVGSSSAPVVDAPVATTAPPPTRVAPTAVVATPQPLSAPNSAWLFVIDGNLWEINGGAPFQLTDGGSLGQAALGDDALVFVERSRNASDLWLASSQGPPRPITRNVSSSASLSHWTSQPVLLPDRQRLYALADLNKASTGEGDLAVWELSFGQIAPVQITSPPAYGGGDQDVTVSPEDPRQIIFTRYAYDGEQLVEQLQWLDVSTRYPVALTPPDQAARQASYSPDATEIAFVARGSGSQEDLYVADLQVSNGRAELDEPRQVVSGVIANPVWTPDGNSLGYLALTANGFQLWSVDIRRSADGTESFGDPRQITSGASLDATSKPVPVSRDQADQVRQWLAPRSPWRATGGGG